MILYDNYIFMNGGINNKRRVLNDCYIININDIIQERRPTWIKIDIDIGSLRSHLLLKYYDNIISFGGLNNYKKKNNNLLIFSNIRSIFPAKNNISIFIKYYMSTLNLNLSIPIEIYYEIDRFYGIYIQTSTIDIISKRVGINGCIINNKLFMLGGYDGKTLNDAYIIENILSSDNASPIMIPQSDTDSIGTNTVDIIQINDNNLPSNKK